jgi:hypothetical protein
MRAMLLAGVAYLFIGRVFALPASDLRRWRLGAWVLSGAVYAVHIWYERYRLHNDSSRSMALHVAMAVAVGAMALALAGMIHSLSRGSAMRPAWLLALVVWPAGTAIPAFCVALGVGALLAHVSRGALTR